MEKQFNDEIIGSSHLFARNMSDNDNSAHNLLAVKVFAFPYLLLEYHIVVQV